MSDLEGLRRDSLPSMDEWRSWMKNAGSDLAKRHYDYALSKVESGDVSWEGYLEIAREVLRKRQLDG